MYIELKEYTMQDTKPVYEKTIVIPVEYAKWKAIRQISFDTEISMSQLIRTAIDKIIKKYDKSVA